MNLVQSLVEKYSVEAKKWSDKVDTEEGALPENTFKGSSAQVASILHKNSDSLKQAMSRLTFYINRAGSNLSSGDKKRLEDAKDKLRALYD